MFKNLFFSGLLLAALGAQTQSVVWTHAFTTSGNSFMVVGNRVQLFQYTRSDSSVNEIQSWPGDFSNFTAVTDGYVFAHVGRSSIHPLGGDVIYKVDFLRNTVVDSTTLNVSGAFDVEVIDGKLYYCRGFGSSSGYLIGLDTNDLTEVFVSSEIEASSGGMAYDGSQLYVAYNHVDTGKIAIYDMQSGLPIYNRTIVMDTLTVGINQVEMWQGQVALSHTRYDQNFNLLYDGMTLFNPSTDQWQTDTTLPSVILNGIDANSLWGSWIGGTSAFNGFGNAFTALSTFGGYVEQDSISGEVVMVNSSEMQTFKGDFSSYFGYPVGQFNSRPSFAYNQFAEAEIILSNLETHMIQSVVTSVPNDAVETNDRLYVADAWVTSSNPLTTQISALNGQVSYTCAPNAVGTDVGFIEVCDGFGTCVVRPLTINYEYPLSTNTTEASSISISPNPVVGKMNISTVGSLINVKIMSIHGEVIYQGTESQVDMQFLPQGIYIVDVLTKDNERLTQKVIVQ